MCRFLASDPLDLCQEILVVPKAHCWKPQLRAPPQIHHLNPSLLTAGAATSEVQWLSVEKCAALEADVSSLPLHLAASYNKALLSAHEGRDERSQKNVKRTVTPLLSARAGFHLAVVLGQAGDKHPYPRQCHGHRALLCYFWLLL